MPLPDDKLLQMVEDVAVTRSKVETLETDVSDLKTDVNDLKLAWDSEDTSRTDIRTSMGEMKKKVDTLEKHSNGGLFEQIKPKTFTAMLKWAAIIVAFLVAGGAGGQGVHQLVEVLIKMLAVVP